MEHLLSHLERERRLIRRYAIKTPLRIRLCKSNGPEQNAESLNLSEYGVYFATNCLLHKDEAVEVILCMPEEVVGGEADEWKCTGRVVRVERIESALGNLGVGVRFDCYEVARATQRRLAKDAKLHKRVELPIVP
jgi:hypothetical protein